jgi:GNAT superfamily N-acetyltransferase
MEIIDKGVLPDSRDYEILRIITPDENIPEEIIRYFIASFGFDNHRVAMYGLAFWRAYFRDSLANTYVPKVIDHHYIMKINGEYAGRLWFGYNTKTLRGNFGNVYTETAFRNQGVMKYLLRHFQADFAASPATMLCCESGNPYAVPAYLRCGFKLIYGGSRGPLALCKNGSFQDVEQAVFTGGDDAFIRPGEIGDQFECDKLLAYSDAVYHFPRHHKFGLGVLLSGFQTAYQETLCGNGGILNVLENSSGALPAYAFALDFFKEDFMDFRFHPAYMDKVPELLQRTAAEFTAKTGRQARCMIGIADTERLEIAARAGLTCVGGVDNVYKIFQ